MEGNIIAESSNFESIESDLDNSLIEKNVHKAIYDCINSLINFIDFNCAIPQKHTGKEEKELIILDIVSYGKDILS